MSCEITGLLKRMLRQTALWQVAMGIVLILAHGQSATAGGGDMGVFPPGGPYSKTVYGAIKWGITREAWTITFSGVTTLTADLSTLTADLDLELLKGTTVVARSTKSGTQPERISVTLDPGTYKFQVYPYGAAQSGYSLRLNFTVAPHCVTELDFNGGTNPKGFVTRTIGTCTTGTTHWIAFTITGTQRVPVRLSGMSIDLDMEIRKGSKAGTVVAYSNKGGTATEDIVTTLNSGTYYLRIYRYGSSGSTSYRNEIQTGGTIR